MHINNEIGSVQPIEEIAKIIKKKNPVTLFHVDAVQGFGKIRVYPKKAGIDLMSISSHKIHGPKGVGVLYVGDGVRLKPISFGGGQQDGLRSGTENVPGIAGMALAAKMLYENLESDVEKMRALKEKLVSEATEIEGVSTVKTTAPHIVSLSFEGVRAEVILHALEDKEIYVSAGSACSTHKPEPSATLKAIGLDKSLLDSTLRFSMSDMTTEFEITETVKALNELVPVLRKFTRR